MIHSPTRDNRELYRLLVEELADYAIFLLDREGRIASWNAGVERILGYREEEFVGQPISIIFTPEDVAQGVPEQERETATREGRASNVRWHLRKDGSRFFVDGVVTAVRTQEGELLGLAEVIRDATKRKQAEAEREQLLAELSRSNEELTQFSSVVSHDLQTPLRMVKSYAQLLEKRCLDRLDATGQEFLRFVLDGTQTMEVLIRGLLAYAQVAEADQRKTLVSLESVVEGVRATLQDLIRETGASVTHDPLPTITGDPVQFLQLFQNLIGNALKYRRDEVAPVVHVAVTETQKEWLFSVRDNGVGIDQKHAEGIFLPLKRLHGGDVPGTGIGLAICKKIVERSGGRIWMKSEVGVGSQFYFTLPRATP